MNDVSLQQVLERLYKAATSSSAVPRVKSAASLQRLEYVSGCLANRACVRLLMACLLGKIDRPHVDPREPYTQIGGSASFSGRMYDEQYITPFINKHALPCNPTTAFLTPALRNINRPLTTSISLVGKPSRVYRDTLKLLEDVALGRETAEDILTDTIRLLCKMRDERKMRMDSLLARVGKHKDGMSLSSEEIITLISQHLACRNASRLPVLVIAAAYTTAGNKIGETVNDLLPHQAADKQTGALGDVQVCLLNDERVATCYEVKQRRVSIEDIDLAVKKISAHTARIDNYIFVTTETIETRVADYARNKYEQLGGVEIAVLAEPDSAVSPPLKEAFLSLRQAAEYDE